MRIGQHSAVGDIESLAARLTGLILAATLTIASIGWALDAHWWFNLIIYPAQFFAAMLAVALPLAYIALPARRKTVRKRVPWFDWLLALCGFTSMGYLAWEYQRLVDLVLLRPADAVVAGTAAIVLSIEALPAGWQRSQQISKSWQVTSRSM